MALFDRARRAPLSLPRTSVVAFWLWLLLLLSLLSFLYLFSFLLLFVLLLFLFLLLFLYLQLFLFLLCLLLLLQLLLLLFYLLLFLLLSCLLLLFLLKQASSTTESGAPTPEHNFERPRHRTSGRAHRVGPQFVPNTTHGARGVGDASATQSHSAYHGHEDFGCRFLCVRVQSVGVLLGILPGDRQMSPKERDIRPSTRSCCSVGASSPVGLVFRPSRFCPFASACAGRLNCRQSQGGGERHGVRTQPCRSFVRARVVVRLNPLSGPDGPRRCGMP